MIILAIDCSTKQSSVAIVMDNKPLYTCVQDCNVTHSQNLLNMIVSALNVTQILKTDIDIFCVTQGPGSFTGVRIGLALIKGIAEGLGKPCVAVSSLKALAACCPFEGVIIPCFDARRRQIYSVIMDGNDILMPEGCYPVDFIEDAVKKCNKSIFFVGDGSELCYNKYGNFENVKTHSLVMPCIAYGAAILAKDIDPVHHSQLTPSYLRLSQAEQELMEKQKGV